MNGLSTTITILEPSEYNSLLGLLMSFILSYAFILPISSFAQWQYPSQWGLSKARLLLIENFPHITN